MLRIVTDSASDITLEEAKEQGVELVSLSIHFEDGIHPQTCREDYDSFYERLQKAKKLPKTSQPPPESFLSVYEEAREKGDEVLVLTLSSGLSGTYQSALIAKDMSEYDKIRVVDTQVAISAQRLLVDQAVQMREEGKRLEEIAEKIKSLSEKIRICGVVDTLTYLKKGGRIPPSLALIGNTLHIKPIMGMKDGKIVSLGKAIGRRGGIKLLFEYIKKYIPDTNFPLYFSYSSNKEMGAQLVKDVLSMFNLDGVKTGLFQASGVIGTHVGPNCMAICYVGE